MKSLIVHDPLQQFKWGRIKGGTGRPVDKYIFVASGYNIFFDKNTTAHLIEKNW